MSTPDSIDEYASSRVKLAETFPTTPEGHIRELVREMDFWTGRIARLEEEMKAAKAKLFEVQLAIPDALDDAYVEEFTLPDGRKVTETLDCIPQVKVEDEQKLWDWMMANGYEDKLKMTITIEYLIGQHEKARKVFAFLNEKIPNQVKFRTHIHDGTAKAFGREVIEKGLTLPPEATIFPLRKAKILPAPRKKGAAPELEQDGS